MSKVQTLRAFIEQRLTAAAEEIFGVFGRTISEYEEELCRQQKLLDAVFKPQVRLHRAALHSDVHKVTAGEEEQQEKSSSPDQEDPPEPPHMKEEQEELWTNQEGEQLQDITEFNFTPVPVKCEDEKKPQSSQLHQTQTEEMKTEDDGEDCGGPEPDRNFNLDAQLTRDTDDFPEPETETDDSDDWKETREPQTSFNFMKNNDLPLNDVRCRSDEKPFSCSVCGKSYRQRKNLTKHVKSHTGETRFTWLPELKGHKCVGESSQLDELRTNQEGERLQNMTESTFTPVPVKRKEDDDEEKPQSSQLHQRPTEQMETEDNGEDCGGPEPARNSDLERHLTPDDKTEDCSEPGADQWKETKEPQSGLNSQKNNEVTVSEVRCKTSKKPFKCSVCRKGFSRRVNLKQHMRTHTGEKPHSCSVCSKGFSQIPNLQVHMRTHTGEKPHSCSVCSKSFSRITNLKRHMRTHTGEKPFGCSVCSKSFSQITHLQVHMRTHTGEKPHSCSVCSKGFSQIPNLQVHMRTHTGEKPFSCSVCNKCFSQYADLKSHMRTHTGEKPYNCQVCNKCFSRGTDLKSHIRSHTGEKPHSCSICNTSFSRKADVRSHMRTHTGEKPYSCSVCSKRFSANANLKSHMRTHTGEKPFSCSVCGKIFTWCKQLKKHKCGAS